MGIIRRNSRILHFITFIPNGLFLFHSVDRSISNIRGAWLVFIITMLYRICAFNATSIDPDQTPRSAASDLGLH